MKMKMNILDTVLFRNGVPFRWLFTSSKTGEVMKKKKDKLNSADILRTMKQKAHALKGKKEYSGLRPPIATVWFAALTTPGAQQTIRSQSVTERELIKLLGEATLPNVLAIQPYLNNWPLRATGVFEHVLAVTEDYTPHDGENPSRAHTSYEFLEAPDNKEQVSIFSTGEGIQRLAVTESQHGDMKAMAKRLVAAMEKQFWCTVANLVIQVVFDASWNAYLVAARAVVLFDVQKRMLTLDGRNEVIFSDGVPPVPGVVAGGHEEGEGEEDEGEAAKQSRRLLQQQQEARMQEIQQLNKVAPAPRPLQSRVQPSAGGLGIADSGTRQSTAAAEVDDAQQQSRAYFNMLISPLRLDADEAFGFKSSGRQGVPAPASASAPGPPSSDNMSPMDPPVYAFAGEPRPLAVVPTQAQAQAWPPGHEGMGNDALSAADLVALDRLAADDGDADGTGGELSERVGLTHRQRIAEDLLQTLHGREVFVPDYALPLPATHRPASAGIARTGHRRAASNNNSNDDNDAAGVARLRPRPRSATGASGPASPYSKFGALNGPPPPKTSTVAPPPPSGPMIPVAPVVVAANLAPDARAVFNMETEGEFSRFRTVVTSGMMRTHHADDLAAAQLEQWPPSLRQYNGPPRFDDLAEAVLQQVHQLSPHRHKHPQQQLRQHQLQLQDGRAGADGEDGVRSRAVADILDAASALQQQGQACVQHEGLQQRVRLLRPASAPNGKRGMTARTRRVPADDVGARLLVDALEATGGVEGYFPALQKAVGVKQPYLPESRQLGFKPAASSFRSGLACAGDYCLLLQGTRARAKAANEAVANATMDGMGVGLASLRETIERTHNVKKRGGGVSAPQQFQLPYKSVLLDRQEARYLGPAADDTRAELKRALEVGKVDTYDGDRILAAFARNRAQRVASKCRDDVLRVEFATRIAQPWDDAKHLYLKLVHNPALESVKASRFYQTAPLCATCFKVYSFLDHQRTAVILSKTKHGRGGSDSPPTRPRSAASYSTATGGGGHEHGQLPPVPASFSTRNAAEATPAGQKQQQLMLAFDAFSAAVASAGAPPAAVKHFVSRLTDNEAALLEHGLAARERKNSARVGQMDAAAAAAAQIVERAGIFDDADDPGAANAPVSASASESVSASAVRPPRPPRPLSAAAKSGGGCGGDKLLVAKKNAQRPKSAGSAMAAARRLSSRPMFSTPTGAPEAVTFSVRPGGAGAGVDAAGHFGNLSSWVQFKGSADDHTQLKFSYGSSGSAAVSSSGGQSKWPASAPPRPHGGRTSGPPQPVYDDDDDDNDEGEAQKGGYGDGDEGGDCDGDEEDGEEEEDDFAFTTLPFSSAPCFPLRPQRPHASRGMIIQHHRSGPESQSVDENSGGQDAGEHRRPVPSASNESLLSEPRVSPPSVHPIRYDEHDQTSGYHENGLMALSPL